MAGSANGRSPFPGLFVAHPPARRNWRAMAGPLDASGAALTATFGDGTTEPDLLGSPVPLPPNLDDMVRRYGRTGAWPGDGAPDDEWLDEGQATDDDDGDGAGGFSNEPGRDDLVASPTDPPLRVVDSDLPAEPDTWVGSPEMPGPRRGLADDIDDRVRAYAKTGIAPPGLLRTAAPATPVLPADSASAGSAARLTTSDAARQRIEGFELNPKTRQPYLDIADDSEGNPTFGYGHKLEASTGDAFRAQLAGVAPADRQAFANKVFSDDLKAAEDRVRDRLGPEALATLNQQQFDALVADAFNAGAGGALGPTMLQNIWDGDMAAAGQQFNAWWAKKAGGRVTEPLPGLVARNLQESAIFNRGDYGFQPDPNIVKRIVAAEKARRAPKR